MDFLGKDGKITIESSLELKKLKGLKSRLPKPAQFVINLANEKTIKKAFSKNYIGRIGKIFNSRISGFKFSYL